MYTYPFNPFKKAIDKVQAKDLAVLKAVSEGWYIDYKEKSIKTIDLAKHLSAFSNQYGGFLIFGIREAEDGSRKAGTFIGVPKEDLNSLSLQIREAAVSHVNPPILYEEHTIEGPFEEINLAANKVILIIGIPQGINPPYIHSSGRIYRRLADQSKPKEETDRYILDDLWKKGKEGRNNLSKFLTRTPELPASQRDNVWAFIYLITDINFPGPTKQLSFEKFRFYTVQCKESVAGLSAPMQSIYSAQGGYVARQVEKNSPGLACPALRWWHGGIARFEIPINAFSIDYFIQKEGRKYEQAFIVELKKQRFSDIRICDLSTLVVTLAALSNIYSHVLKEIGDNRRVYATYELHNVFYMLPFINSIEYIRRCSADGIPVIQDHIIRYAETPYFDNMLRLPVSEQNSDISAEKLIAPYLFIAPIAYDMLNVVGIASDPNCMTDYEIWVHDLTNQSNF